MNFLKDTRPVWAEINLDNLAHNIREVKRVTKDDTQITAVVKADGYGHGAVMASRVFLKNGGDRLAVATLSEAIELRRANIKVPILILGYTPVYQAENVIKFDITQTVYTYEQAKAISQAAIKYEKIGKIHLKIDSGMSRLGFMGDSNTIDEITKISKLPNVHIEGIFTHFALADEKDKQVTRSQFDKFQWVIEKLEDRNIYIPIKHVSNSAAIIDLPEYNLNLVRAGIMLYGLYPSNEVKKTNVNLKPAMTLKANISHLKEVPKGTGVSYGHIYTADKSVKIGTLPIGYADGYTRMLTNKAEISVKSRRAPIIGKICMDQCMIDLTDINDVKPGDEVVLFGDGSNNSPHIDEIAERLGTINYEIVCMVGKRVPRVYMQSGEIVDIRDYVIEN